MMHSRPLVSLVDSLDALATAAQPFVAVEHVPLANAHRVVLAGDVLASADVPPGAIALRGGYAVCAADTVDASAMAPVPLPSMPRLLAPGDALPAGTDSILPPHALEITAGVAEAIAAAAPWTDVRRAGEDAERGAVIVAAGAVLTACRVAALAALGIDTIPVRRPSVALSVPGSSGVTLRAMVKACGGDVADSDASAVALRVSAGGNGVAPDAVRIALQPGLGEAAHVCAPAVAPLIMLPTRPEAALSVMVALVMPLLDRLTRRAAPRAAMSLPVAGKIAVCPGLSHVVLVARDGDRWRVLAVGDLPLSSWAQADAFAVLGPESEGLPPGAPLTATLLMDAP